MVSIQQAAIYLTQTKEIFGFIGHSCRPLVKANANKWAERHHITFLLTHHPPSWLSKNAQHEYTAEIYSRRRFSAHLFGHTHEAAVSEERQAGGTPRVQLQSRSFFRSRNLSVSS